MTAGRTVIKYANVFADGYDLTGYSRTFGPLTWSYTEADATTIGDSVKNALPDVATVNVGAISAVLDNTTNASHDRLNGQRTSTILIPIGGRAAPAQGDPCFQGVFMQKEFTTMPNTGNAVTISANYSGWAGEASSLLYSNPWGWLLAPKSARTTINSAIGIDDYGAATAKGGFMCYQLFTSNGTVNMKVQDAATNTDVSFADLAASGLVTAAVTPTAGIVALSPTATVRRYLRWQMTLGTATTATFAIGFVRAF